MKHLIIFFYFVSFTTGFSFIMLGIFLWLKNRQEILKYFVFTASSLTLILLEQMITAYDLVNIVDNKFITIMLRYISAIGCGLMIYALTNLSRVLSGKFIKVRSRQLIILGSVLPVFLTTFYNITNNQITLKLADILIFGILLFDIVFLALNAEKIDNIILKSMVKKILIASLILFPIMVIDVLIEKLPVIGRYFPYGLFSVMGYYIVFNGISLYSIIKNYNDFIKQPSAFVMDNLDVISNEENSNIVNNNDNSNKDNSNKDNSNKDNSNKDNSNKDNSNKDNSNKDNSNKDNCNIDNFNKDDSNNIKNINNDVFHRYNITNREKEVIHLLIQGYSYNDISERLVISIPTVKSHIHNIYKKFNIKNKIELINKISPNNIYE